MEWLFYIFMVLFFFALPAIIVNAIQNARARAQQEQLDTLKKELSFLRRQVAELRQQVQASTVPSDQVSSEKELLEQPSLPADPPGASTEPVPATPQMEETPSPSAGETSPPPPPFPGRPSVPASQRVRPKSALDQNVDPMGWLLRFFTGERALVRLGVLLVLLGMGFLLKLTVSQDLAVPFKLLIAASCAGILAGWGWYVRRTRKVFSVALQGGALGILYFMVYASSVLYGILSFTGGLMLWLLVGLIGGMLALRQNAQVLAVVSVVGGFLAAIVMRTGNLSLTPDLMGLVFMYYTLLNAGIVWLSFLRLWRYLNVMGYLFTFLIASLWGVLEYTPQYYAVAQPFLIVFFLMYTLTPLVHALRRNSGRADYSLLLSVPVLTLLQQAALLGGSRTGVAVSSLTIALVQYGLYLYTRSRSLAPLVAETYQTLAIGFAVLAVPLLTSARTTSAIWTLAGVLLVVFGVRGRNRVRRVWGTVLLYLSLGALLMGWIFGVLGQQPYMVLSSLIWTSVALLFTGVFLQQSNFAGLARGLLITGGISWIVSAIDVAFLLYPGQMGFATILLPLSLFLLVLHVVARQYQVQTLSRFDAVLPVWAALSALMGFMGDENPLDRETLPAWAIYFVVQYYFLFTSRWSAQTEKMLHLVTTYLLFGRLMVLVGALLDARGLGIYTWVLVPLVFYWGHVLLWNRLPYTRKYPDLYRDGVMLPLQLLQAGVFLFLMVQPPALPYLPFLNLLEGAQVALYVTLFHHQLPWNTTPASRRFRRNALILGGVLGISGMIVRFMHAQFGVPWDFGNIVDHNNTQTVLSIFWSITALIFTLYANRSRDRDLWTIGAGILVFVVVKLFILDLSGSDTWARVISFLGVGLLLLFMGFVAPVPPRKEEPHSKEEQA